MTAGTQGARSGRAAGPARRLLPPEIGLLTRRAALGHYLLVHDPDGRPKPRRMRDESESTVIAALPRTVPATSSRIAVAAWSRGYVEPRSV